MYVAEVLLRCSSESVKQAPDLPPRPAGKEEKGEMVVSIITLLSYQLGGQWLVQCYILFTGCSCATQAHYKDEQHTIIPSQGPEVF